MADAVPTDLSAIDRPGLAQQRMAERYRPILALRGGTPQMRSEGTTWLPQEPREADDVYHRRLARSFLFEGYRDGVEGIVSKPFSRPVNVIGLHPDLEYLLTNCDGQGTSLTSYAAGLLRDAIDFGMGHGFVDAPVPPKVPSSKAEEDAMGLRPYFCRLWSPDVIGAVHGPNQPNGLPVLRQLRVREKRMAYKGFEEKEQRLVRVWSLNEQGQAVQQLYAHRDTASGGTAEWTPEGGASPIGYTGGIPHAALILDPVSATEGRPPMEGLAWMNVRHWVTTSDQNNILRMARCPILFHKLLAPDQELTIAVTRAVGGGGSDSDLRWVEIQGASIEAGFTDIRDIEAKMRQLAMEPLVRQSGTVTATENAIGEAQSQSQAQSWVRLTEATLERLFRIAAAWAGKELETDFRVDIFNDFGVQARAAHAADVIIKLMDNKYLPVEDGLSELQHMAYLSDGLDTKLIAEQMADEREKNALKMSGLGGLFGGDYQPPPPAPQGDPGKLPETTGAAA